jgi:hypothetical protein
MLPIEIALANGYFQKTSELGLAAPPEELLGGGKLPAEILDLDVALPHLIAQLVHLQEKTLDLQHHPGRLR